MRERTAAPQASDARKLPAVNERLANALAVLHLREFVHIVDRQDVRTVEAERAIFTAAILSISDRCIVIVGFAHRLRPGVVAHWPSRFVREPAADAGLETVIVAPGAELIERDARVALVRTEGIVADCSRREDTGSGRGAEGKLC